MLSSNTNLAGKLVANEDPFYPRFYSRPFNKQKFNQ